MLKVSVFLCLLPAVFAGYLESIAASAAVGPQDRFQGMVAFQCGRPSLHLTPSGGWVRDLTQDCVTSADEIRTYCQRVYPDREMVNVEPAPYRVRIANWCGFDQKHCTAEQTNEIVVHPYRCLAAGFQSDALLVPSNCTFHHLVPGINGDATTVRKECKAHEEWENVAKDECKRRSNSQRRLRSFSGLLECKRDEKHKYSYFKGVEFVCCPPQQAASPPATGLVMEVSASRGSTPKRDLYVDYLNRADDKSESEHDRYVSAKEDRKKKMTEDEDRLVRAYIEAERDIETKWRIDLDTSRQEEETVIQRFKAAFTALLNEEMDELRQLDHIHQERVFTKLHAKSERCKKMLEYASQEVDPKTSPRRLDRISTAAFAYLRAVMKEKVHAINHHTHLLDSDPQQAKEQLPRLRTYLARLRKDIRRIVEDLAKSVPKMQKEVKMRILKFMRTYSEVESSAQSLEDTGRLSANPIKGQSRKDVEMDHMQNVIKAYRHREPQQPMHREKMVHVVPVEDEEVEIEKKHERVHHANGHEMKHSAKALHHSRDQHISAAEPGQRATLVMSSASTWAIVGSVAAVALVAALTAVLVLRRRYAGYSRSPHADPATIAVEKSLAPSAVDDNGDLAAMQTNGYENPTYKYFELQGQEGDKPKA